MRAFSSATLLVAGLHFAAISSPSVALAQAPQPVPYATAPAPVPYGTPAPSPTPSAIAPGGAPAGQAAQGSNATGGDVIYMKNGGILRGTIVDAIPGAQARIQLATGEIATVPWPEISRIEHAEAPRTSTLPPLPAGRGPATTAPSSSTGRATTGGQVWVHIEGSDDARLEQDTSGHGEWRIVCQAPCDRPLSNVSDYRITGAGMRNSAVFHLRGQQGDRETITVSPGSKGWFVAGIVLTPVGGVVALVGVLVGFVGSVVSSASTPGSQDQVSASNTATAGWTTAVVGLAALVGGIILIASNARTSAAQDVASAQTGLRVRDDAWKRVPTPTWKEAGATEKSLPPSLGVPILSGRF